MNVRELTRDLEIRAKSQRGNYRRISDSYGIDYSWLVKFANGKMPNPTVDNLHALQVALDREEKKSLQTMDSSDVDMVIT